MFVCVADSRCRGQFTRPLTAVQKAEWEAPWSETRFVRSSASTTHTLVRVEAPNLSRQPGKECIRPAKKQAGQPPKAPEEKRKGEREEQEKEKEEKEEEREEEGEGEREAPRRRIQAKGIPEHFSSSRR